jgi:hypothetical protein
VIVGSLALLVLGGIAGMIYGFLFRTAGLVEWRVGAGIGLAHWLIAGILLYFFPSAASGLPKNPGFFAARYGESGFVEVLALHVVFGITTALIYRFALSRQATERLPAESQRAYSPLADSLGQGNKELDEYRDQNRSA